MSYSFPPPFSSVSRSLCLVTADTYNIVSLKLKSRAIWWRTSTAAATCGHHGMILQVENVQSWWLEMSSPRLRCHVSHMVYPYSSQELVVHDKQGQNDHTMCLSSFFCCSVPIVVKIVVQTKASLTVKSLIADTRLAPGILPLIKPLRTALRIFTLLT